MSELIRDGGDDLIGVGGNNGELVGCLGTFDNVISGKVGNKAVGDAEGDRLIVRISALGVDEKGSNRHKSVQDKGDHEKVGLGLYLVDIAGKHICAAGAGIVLHADAVDKTGNSTADDNRIDGVMSLGVVLDKLPTGILQEQIGEGVDHREDQRSDSKAFLDKEVSKNAEGDIDEQGHIADAEACLILDHGSDTVETCRSEMVLYDEDMIDDRQQHCHSSNGDVG